MPTFQHGKQTRILLQNKDVSQYFREVSSNHEIEMAETTTFNPSGDAKTFVVGLNNGTLSVEGLFDGSVGAIDEILSGLLGGVTPPIFTVGVLAAGSRVLSGKAHHSSYEISSPLGDVVSTSMELQVTGGLGHGVSLCDLVSVGASTNGSSVDNSILSSNGGFAVLHVTVNTRSAAADFKVQHSTDGVSWVDLATFTQVGVGATTQELISVSGTVNRYLRCVSTLTAGTGSVTYHINFARRA